MKNKNESIEQTDTKSLLCSGLTEVSKKIHEDNRDKGFWDSDREIGTLLMLVTSELAEALEADRKGNYCGKIKREELDGKDFPAWFEKNVKDTFEDEMADTVIRILDICGAMDIDLEWHINQKLKYNRTRAHKHSKAY